MLASNRSRTLRIFFDTRSARIGRLTGWERYTRGLWEGIKHDDRVTEMSTISPNSVVGRLASDVQLASRQFAIGDIRHFPTFPPVKLSSNTVYTVHDLTWWTHVETASRLGRDYYRHLATRTIHNSWIVVHSQTVAEEVVDRFGVDRNRIGVVSPGVEFPVSLTPRSAVSSRPYLFTLATVEPRKNLDRLVMGYQASGLSHHVPLVVAGRSAWGNLPKGVRHLGVVTDEQLRKLYADALGVVVPSIYEGFGLPVLEAASFGTPVACSDIPVFREITGGAAIFFNPLDIDSIAEGLIRLVNGAETGLSAQAKIRAGKYTWQAAASDLLNFYEVVARGA